MNTIERANTGLHSGVLAKVDSLHLLPHARILDLGCGSGEMLRNLAARGYTCLFGLDISPPLGSSAIRYLEGDMDACATGFENGSTDLILAVEVLEHVENMGVLLKEVARILKPGGWLLATTPNVMSLESRLRFLLLGKLKQFDEIGDPTHVYPIFPHPFGKVLHRHGLEVAQRWSFPEDGSSPTSRPSLRAAAGLLAALGLRGVPRGDNLCLLIRKLAADGVAENATKKSALTAHY